MSAALVRKSLEIVDSEKELKKVNKKSKKSKGALDLIPEGHRAVKTIGKKGKKEKHSVLSRNKKLTLTEARKNLIQRGNNTEINIKKLQLLSSGKINEETASKLIERARVGHVTATEEEKHIEQESVFTEEDFLKFEREYFCS